MKMTRTLVVFLGALILAGASAAEDKNPADYPIRFHIFNRAEHSHFHHGVLDFTEGDGHANIFLNGEVHAVDFHFNCGARIERSMPYETYTAKWHKPGKSLTVVFPVSGKTGKFFTCDLDTDVKPDTAYVSHGDNLRTEPAADFKAWMLEHEYDPEHDKNTPTSTDPAK